MSNVITLLSDFGNRDSYVAQMKGALISQAMRHSVEALPPRIVDISHEIPPQDVRYGARVLWEAAMRFPKGTVHVAVVDPGVGTGRRIVALEAHEHLFVAPDNGLLDLVLEGNHECSKPEAFRAYSVENSALWLADVSSTFHGRDIMAPVAAYLALGGKLPRVGPPAVDLVRLAAPILKHDGNGWMLEVTGIDHFGNVLTSATRPCLAELVHHKELQVRIGSKAIKVPLVDTYGQAQVGSLVAVFGSQRMLELAVVNGSAAVELGLCIGDTLRIHVE